MSKKGDAMPIFNEEMYLYDKNQNSDLFHLHSFEIKLILQLLVLFLPWLEMTMQSKAMPPSNASFRYQILSNQVSNIIIKYQVSDFQILEKVFFLSFLIPFI